MVSPGEPRLVDSFTAPKDVIIEFEQMAEEDINPFAETASKRQIAARQSCHNRSFSVLTFLHHFTLWVQNIQCKNSVAIVLVITDGASIDGLQRL